LRQHLVRSMFAYCGDGDRKGTSERQLQPMPVRQCQVTVNAQTMKAGTWLPTNKLDKLDKPDKPAALQHSEST